MGRRRTIILQDEAFQAATLVRAAQVTSGDGEQAGRKVEQAVQGGPTVFTNAPVGDIRPLLSGVPEADGVDLNLTIQLPGPVERARFGWRRAGDATASDVQIRQSPMVCGRRPAIVVRDAIGAGVKDWKNNPRLIPIKFDHTPNIDTSVYGSDGLLLLHMNQTNDRVRSIEGLGVAQLSLYRTYGAAVAQWEQIALTAGELDCYADINSNGGPLNHVVAADGVQFPDTGEVVVVIAAQDKMGISPNQALDARFYAYSSPSAGEAGSWVLKSRSLLSAYNPDILLPGPLRSITNIAVERLPSGRLLLVWLTRDELFCSTSDDRGSTWSGAVQVASGLNTGNNEQGPYALDISVMSNGLAVIVYTDNLLWLIGGNWISPRAYYTSTYDGKSFTTPFVISDGDIRNGGATNPVWVEPAAMAVCERPDGYPQFYCTTHRGGRTPDEGDDEVDVDWLCSATAIKKELSLSDDSRTDVFPRRGFSAFHCLDSIRGPALKLTGFTEAITAAAPFQGFCGVAAVRWRGQIVIAAQVAFQTAKGVSDPVPEYAMNAIVVHRTNHWQPLKEILQACTFPTSGGGAIQSHGIPLDPVGGRVYNLTWDGYDDPTRWGWALAALGAGTTTFGTTAGGGDGLTHGGYVEINSSATPGSRYYTRLGIPGSELYVEGAFRYVFQIVSGIGSVGVKVNFRGGANMGGVYVVAVRNSANSIKFEVFDKTTTASLGIYTFTETGDGDLWYEVIGSVWEQSGFFYASCFVRRHPISTDPDWDEPYQEVAFRETVTTAAAGIITSYFFFGNALDLGGSAAVKSRWKTVQIHKTDRFVSAHLDSTRPANQRSTLYKVTEIATDEDSDMYNVLIDGNYGARHAHIDDGVMNVMRTSLSSAVPPQFLSRGISAAWRGEATSMGVYEAETAYQFGAKKIVDAPVMHEWRSRTDSADSIEILFDAGATGRPFRPNAVALFRRNFPTFVFGLGDTEAASDISYLIGMPNQDILPDRYCHLWACKPNDGNGWMYCCGPYRLTVYRGTPDYGSIGEEDPPPPPPPPESATPWRPHQFRTTETGPRYYLWVHRPGGAIPFVFRIVDNTEDTLIFATDLSGIIGTPLGGPIENGRDYSDAIAIFSDRCAVEFEHLWADTFICNLDLLDASPNSHMLGYRYLRLAILPCNHQDADENFYRLGRMIAGTSFRLDSPDFEWFFRESLLPGTDIERLPGGVTRADARHVPVRQWTVDRNVLHPRREPDAVMVSPEDKGPKSWVEFIELAQRLEGAGEAFALVWRSERARGVDGEAVVQIASDYHDLAHVRVVNHGEARNNIWECQTINGPEGAEVIDGPMAQVTSITFEEDL